MRTIAGAALFLVFVAAPQARDENDFQYQDSLERVFAPAGQVNLDLSAGDYQLRRGDDRGIRVVWKTRTREQMAETRVRVEVRGTEAAIRTDGPDKDFHVEIELPRRSDLFLRMSAGDLSIAGIEGNKDVRLRAGDLHIEVADPAQYGHVQASVTAGDISAEPFGISTGGLFRSFKHEGGGRFELRARLWAGDLTLKAPNVP